jgi:hypothetical protein
VRGDTPHRYQFCKRGAFHDGIGVAPEGLLDWLSTSCSSKGSTCALRLMSGRASLNAHRRWSFEFADICPCSALEHGPARLRQQVTPITAFVGLPHRLRPKPEQSPLRRSKQEAGIKEGQFKPVPMTAITIFAALLALSAGVQTYLLATSRPTEWVVMMSAVACAVLAGSFIVTLVVKLRMRNAG